MNLFGFALLGFILSHTAMSIAVSPTIEQTLTKGILGIIVFAWVFLAVTPWGGDKE